jgi:FtsH-binding integral membrane protein
VVNFMTSIVTIVLAYVVSISLYLLVVRVSEIPQSDLWNEGFKMAFQFVALAFLVLGLLIPTFQKEFDPGLRVFSLFTAILLVAYTVCRVVGIDPNGPLRLLNSYVVDPLLHWAQSLHT